MYDNITKYFSENEIKLLTAMINSINVDSITNYCFKKPEIDRLLDIYNLKQEVIDSLKFKRIILESVSKVCKNCGELDEICECKEKEIVKKVYYKIVYKVFIEYFIETFSLYYKVKLNKIDTSDEDIIQYNIKNYEIIIEIYGNLLQKEFCNQFNLKNKLAISIMPLEFDCPNLRIYEWSEILDKENINRLQIKINELNDEIKNKDFYFIDVGDDASVEDVENMRMVLRKYLLKIGFDNFTENKKYKPEYLKYLIPAEKIKECYIKDNYKILVLKPTEKQLSIVYFQNESLIDSGYLYDIVRDYDKFIKNKIDKLRKIKSLETKSDKSQKIIQLIVPIINLVAIITPTIASIFVANKFISNMIKLFDHIQLFKILYIGFNIIGIILVSIYTIYPYLLRSIFKWERGINKYVPAHTQKLLCRILGYLRGK